jgi:hypothetical protein
MPATPFRQCVEQPPKGRERAKQEALSRVLRDAWIVQVPYSPEPLWLVPGKLQARELHKWGTPRSRIWTLAEAQSLLDACGSPVSTLEEAARMLASEAPDEAEAFA